VASGEVGQLLVTSAGGALKGAGAGLKFSDDTLTVANLGAFKATGPIDFDNQRLSNIAINGGSVSDTVRLFKRLASLFHPNGLHRCSIQTPCIAVPSRIESAV
jgi:hypothetical protein